MIEEVKLTNWYYISALVLFTKEDKISQSPWSGVIPVDADKITAPMLEQMSTFVAGKFLQENEMKADDLHSVTLMSVSFLGRMSAKEFQGVTNATDTVQ